MQNGKKIIAGKWLDIAALYVKSLNLDEEQQEQLLDKFHGLEQSYLSKLAKEATKNKTSEENKLSEIKSSGDKKLSKDKKNEYIENPSGRVAWCIYKYIKSHNKRSLPKTKVITSEDIAGAIWLRCQDMAAIRQWSLDSSAIFYPEISVWSDIKFILLNSTFLLPLRQFSALPGMISTPGGTVPDVKVSDTKSVNSEEPTTAHVKLVPLTTENRPGEITSVVINTEMKQAVATPTDNKQRIQENPIQVKRDVAMSSQSSQEYKQSQPQPSGSAYSGALPPDFDVDAQQQKFNHLTLAFLDKLTQILHEVPREHIHTVVSDTKDICKITAENLSSRSSSRVRFFRVAGAANENNSSTVQVPPKPPSPELPGSRNSSPPSNSSSSPGLSSGGDSSPEADDKNISPLSKSRKLNQPNQHSFPVSGNNSSSSSSSVPSFG